MVPGKNARELWAIEGRYQVGRQERVFRKALACTNASRGKEV